MFCDLLVLLFGVMWFLAGKTFFIAEPKTEHAIRQHKLFMGVFAGTFFIVAVCFFATFSLRWVSSVVFWMVFLCSLAITIDYDYCERMIPRFCSLLPIPFFLGLRLSCSAVDFLEFAFAAVSVCLLLRLIAFLFERFTGRVGMGEGDPEFAAMIASFVGLELIGPIIVLASIFGVVHSFVSKWKDIPFGSALGIATIVLLVLQQFL